MFSQPVQKVLWVALCLVLVFAVLLFFRHYGSDRCRWVCGNGSTSASTVHSKAWAIRPLGSVAAAVRSSDSAALLTRNTPRGPQLRRLLTAGVVH